jgi:tRNA pseudouridine55 synthase
MDGVIIVDKPLGPTSHDVVQRIRKTFKTREVGHAGTLDPMATGVLVVAIGEATKLIPYLTAGDKSYDATIRLGVATDTLDAEGKETERAAVPASLDLEAALSIERARTEQIPPAFSAIHANGERAHEKARRGESVDLPPRPVSVRALELVRHDGDVLGLRLVVSKGYYVRSLARDLAAALGTVGHLTALRRTRSGAFSLSDVSDTPIPLSLAAARTLPIVELDEIAAANARHGRPIDASGQPKGPCAWVHAGTLIAIGEDGRVLRGFKTE